MKNASNMLTPFFFNEQQYLANKVAAANAEGGNWNVKSMSETISQCGMTAFEHFVRYGAFEKNAAGGVGIDPGVYFSLDKYYSDKASSMNKSTPGLNATKESMAQTFKAHGLDPISHYALYGYSEGLAPASQEGAPNFAHSSATDCYTFMYFREDEYLANKAAAFNKSTPGQQVTAQDMLTAITQAGMTPLQHFKTYGAFEVADDGKVGIDPGSFFDVSRYYENKLGVTPGLTSEALVQALRDSALDPISHYAQYGFKEGIAPVMTNLGHITPPASGSKVPMTGNALVDPIVINSWDTIQNWNKLGVTQGNVIYYNYLKDVNVTTTYNFVNNKEFEELTALQKQGFEQGFATLSRVTGIKFEQSDASKANIYVYSANIGTSLAVQSDGNTAYKTSVAMNKTSIYEQNADTTFGHTAFATVIHELGHALGLEHPFLESGVAPFTRPVLPTPFENMANTVMSYTRGPQCGENWNVEGSFYYSPLDLLALNHLYGTDGLNGKEGIVYGPMPDVQFV